MKFLVLDTETTGLVYHPGTKDEVQPQIIEFGAVLVDEEGAEEQRASMLINPRITLPEKITQITGITDDDLVGCPVFAECYPAIRDLFSEADCAIAHNLPFDRRMVQMEVRRLAAIDWRWPQHQVCTAAEFTAEYGRRPSMKDLFAHITGEPLHQTHRAIDDVEALLRICRESGLLYDIATTARPQRV